MPKGKSFFVVLIALSLTVAVLLTQMPTRGFDTDLSALGEGRPAVVMGFINHSPRGIRAMNSLGEVRDSYEDAMLFLVADMMADDGADFAERYGIGDGDMALFDAQGRHLESHPVPDDEEQLRRLLDPVASH